MLVWSVCSLYEGTGQCDQREQISNDSCSFCRLSLLAWLKGLQPRGRMPFDIHSSQSEESRFTFIYTILMLFCNSLKES